MRIDGTPVMTSAENRMAPAAHPSDSARKRPASSPSGMVTAVAIAPMMTVPRMAFHTPPLGMPSGLVGWVKKPVLQAGRPLARVYRMTATSGITAMTRNTQQIPMATRE